MNFQKFTIKSQEAVQSAQEIAASFNNQAIEPEHLLAALVQDADGVVVPVLRKIGADTDAIKMRIPGLIEKLPRISGAGSGNFYFGQAMQSVFDAAVKEAQSLKDEFVSTEHLLLAMTQGRSAAGRLLADQGVTKDRIFRALKDVRGRQRVTDQTPEEKYRALSKFGRDLNELARKGKIDPVIGRGAETGRDLQG